MQTKVEELRSRSLDAQGRVSLSVDEFQSLLAATDALEQVCQVGDCEEYGHCLLAIEIATEALEPLQNSEDED